MPPRNMKIWEYLFLVTDQLRNHALSQEPIRDMAFFHALSINQGRLLKMLLHLTHFNPEGVTLKQLAGKLSVSPAAASEMVENLVKKGLIVRLQNPEDRRSILIDFSGETKEKLQAVNRFLDRTVGEIMKDFTAEEQALFINMMERFLTALPE